MRIKPVTRRQTLAILGSAALPMFMPGAAFAQSRQLPTVQSFRNPGCGCCELWVGHMRQAGFEITMADHPDLAGRKRTLGVPDNLAGCHTALIGTYVFEGHVPPQDIVRFLTEKPQAIGLAVPGMPVGSPGMEMGDQKEPYDVVLFRKDGSTEIYARYA